ncbi:hypothetical protein [Streptomyces noursei]|uniref:hypothetical protein n=1 Tax=Streptomyces noursei TaxID=1971 RepID=UPI0023B7A6BE|nr:hypothetical protein [Streptomyces noursei]
MKLKNRLSALAATTALLAGLGGTVGATTAQAASPCDRPAVTNNSSAYGYFLGDYRLKTAPAAECGTVVTVAAGSKFYMWCYVTNYYGNIWVYGRVEGTEVKGWESYDNVSWVSGSLNHC